MTVFAFDTASESMRGELTRWFLEIKPGVFVGKVNIRISDLLWERFNREDECRGAIRIETTINEQGFRLYMHGTPNREVVDCEGVQLIRRVTVAQEGHFEETEEDIYPENLSWDM